MPNSSQNNEIEGDVKVKLMNLYVYILIKILNQLYRYLV